MINNQDNTQNTTSTKTYSSGQQSNKKWKIMTAVFGGIAVAGLATSIAVPLALKSNNSTTEELKEHKINVPTPAVAGWSAKLIDTEAKEVTQAKKGTELILYLENSQSNTTKIPEYFTINNLERKYYFTSADNLYYALFTIPEAKEMTINTFFTEVQETVDLTFATGEHGKIEGSSSLKVTKGTKFGTISNLPETKPDDGYKFDGWYIGSTKLTSETELSENATITAQFVAIEYKTLTFNYESDKGTLYYNSQKVESGTTVKIEAGTKWGDLPHPTPVAVTGYRATGFYAFGKYLNPDHVFEADTTITAKFDPLAFNVSTSNCLGLEVVSDSTIQWRQTGASMLKPVIYYTTTDAETVPSDQWLELTEDTVLDLPAGSKLFLRSFNLEGISDKQSYVNFKILPKTGTSGSVKMSGHLCALMDGGLGLEATVDPCDYAFQHMFEGSTGLISFKNTQDIFPSRIGSCQYMFKGCSNLTTSNLVPSEYPNYAAKEMYYDCTQLTGGFKWNMCKTYGAEACRNMFTNCKALLSTDFSWYRYSTTEVVECGNYCFYGMFQNCWSFTELRGGGNGGFHNAKLGISSCAFMFEKSGVKEIPSWFLSANSFGETACHKMFNECQSLTKMSDVALCSSHATYIGNRAFEYMFYGCKNLETAAVDLSEVAIGESACSGMFQECEKLKTVELFLRSKTLSTCCYYQMFYGCKSLTGVYAYSDKAVLPATKLADSCYQSMFQECTSLIVPPIIQAETTTYRSCGFMFIGCSSLKVIEAEQGGTKFFTCPPTAKSDDIMGMFSGTGGSFTGEPNPGKTYCYDQWSK